MLEKEIERVGIPAVLVTSLTPTARMLGANRIVQGVGITHPLGDAKVSLEEEKTLRRRILSEALQTLAEKIQKEEKNEKQEK